MAQNTDKTLSRNKRARRVRYKICAASTRPRLTVFRSNKNIFAQIVDDRRGVTLVAASTLEKDFRREPGAPFDKAAAREVGKRLAERAKEKAVERVIFDRGPYLYHGKVKALAEGAREGGLDF